MYIKEFADDFITGYGRYLMRRYCRLRKSILYTDKNGTNVMIKVLQKEKNDVLLGSSHGRFLMNYILRGIVINWV